MAAKPRIDRGFLVVSFCTFSRGEYFPCRTLYIPILLLIGVAAPADEPARVLGQSDFERDSDGDGVADGWHRWSRNERGGPDPSATYWIETDEPAGGSSAQGCRITQPEAGIRFPFSPVIGNGLFRSTIRIKVRSGEVIVQGQGQHSVFGWNVMTTENAGQWTEIRREFRPMRWQVEHAGIIAFSREGGTEFLLDDLTIEVIDEGGKDPPIAPWSTPVGPDKKILNACGSSPTIAWVRDNVEQLERAPFEGTTLKLSHEFANLFWSRNKVARGLVDQAIADLKATRFHKFTDNFIWCNTVPGGSAGSPDYMATGSTTVGGTLSATTPAWRPGSASKGG